ncbi:MAG: hypothetical protein RL722_2581, partial [Pseudomonadota bacterium]
MTEPRLPPAAVEVADAPTPLDALQLPLWGSRLIEASAGTGKTWTIAALYLRLVLGHGAGDGDEASGHGRPLAPSEILVMTFTRAATRELSDRIRARLVEAAACFRGRQLPAAHDHFLAGLLAAYPEGPAREQAAWRLALAAEAMDDAAVHTIDAWCQRMLREHAFDSGSLFDEELQADEQALLAEACRDYWRQQIYPLGDGAILDAILSLWPHVQALQRSVQALLPHGVDGSQTMSAGSLADLVGPQVAELQALKQGWVDKAAALGAWLPGQLEGKQPALKKGSYPANQWPGWIKALDAWARAPAQVLPDLADKAWTALSLDGVDAARTDRSQPLDLPAAVAAALAELEALHPRLQALDQQPPLAGQLALHAAAQVAQRLAQFKRQRGSFGFADLQERLDAALAGPAGARLRQRIVQQTPVALVDEFQDTSPLQYRLFDRLYDTAANARGSALFLIGDPKQSIYAFRGADIHSYLAARQATRGRHYLLDTNYRSTTALVGAVNQLFGQAERGSTRGAFLFRAEATAVTAATAPEPAAVANPLPFLAVAAHGRSDRLVDAQGPLPALTVLADPRPATAAQIQRRYAVHCAEHIVALLNEPACGYEHDDGRPRRRLAPGDIAVLVRTGREARAVRRALAERQVASVYLSDQESVYASREAADLLLWLQAVADPLDARRARAALATATLDLPLAELARLSQNDLAFEARVEQLRQLASVWRRQGVLPMLRRSLHLLRLPARWLARPDGERRITNLLHLAELLQA